MSIRRPYFWLYFLCQETWVCFLTQIHALVISAKTLDAFVPPSALWAKGIKRSSQPPKGALRLHSCTAPRHSPATLLVARYKPKRSTPEVLANLSSWRWYFLSLSFLFLGFSTEDSHLGSDRLNLSTLRRNPASAVTYADRNAPINSHTASRKLPFS